MYNRRARGVLEIEMEEAREYLVVDEDVTRQKCRLCIISLPEARREQGRFLAVRHVRRSGGGAQCTRRRERGGDWRLRSVSDRRQCEDTFKGCKVLRKETCVGLRMKHLLCPWDPETISD